MTIAFVQQEHFGSTTASGNSLPFTLTTAPTAGNAIVGIYCTYGGTTSVPSSITDSAGNTYTLTTPDTSALTGYSQVGMFYLTGIAGGATSISLNFTSLGGQNAALAILEYSGASSVNATLAATANSSPGTSISYNIPTTAPSMVSSFLVWNITPTAGSGYTDRFSSGGSGLDAEDQLFATSGTKAITWTQASNSGVQYTAIAFAATAPVVYTPPGRRRTIVYYNRLRV